jgi:hypothetical protein
MEALLQHLNFSTDAMTDSEEEVTFDLRHHAIKEHARFLQAHVRINILTILGQLRDSVEADLINLSDKVIFNSFPY